MMFLRAPCNNKMPSNITPIRGFLLLEGRGIRGVFPIIALRGIKSHFRRGILAPRKRERFLKLREKKILGSQELRERGSLSLSSSLGNEESLAGKRSCHIFLNDNSDTISAAHLQASSPSVMIKGHKFVTQGS